MHLCIQYMITSSSLVWFPNSDIRGSGLICSSPRLFAACHVLRRLLMPRHSPYALFSLNFSLAWVSQIISFYNEKAFSSLFLFFALTLSSLGSIAVFLPRFLERPFYLTLFLKSQNYLFVFLLYSVSNDLFVCHIFRYSYLLGNSFRCAGGLKWSRVTLRFFRLYFV